VLCLWFFSEEEISEIEKYFTSRRKSLPPLFIVTPTDHKKSVWTSSAPSLTILIRLAQLAQAAISVLEEQYSAKKPNLDAWKVSDLHNSIPDIEKYISNASITGKYVYYGPAPSRSVNFESCTCVHQA